MITEKLGTMRSFSFRQGELSEFCRLFDALCASYDRLHHGITVSDTEWQQ